MGNNAEPVNSGRCCDECNYVVVCPARISQPPGALGTWQEHIRFVLAKHGMKPSEES